jgi:hypothetical protein
VIKLHLVTIDPRFVSMCIWWITGPRCQFLCVDRIVDGSCSNNFIKIIMNVLLKVGGVEQRRFVQEIIVFWNRWGECISRVEN